MVPGGRAEVGKPVGTIVFSRQNDWVLFQVFLVGDVYGIYRGRCPGGRGRFGCEAGRRVQS